jgi:hypothetical protein
VVGSEHSTVAMGESDRRATEEWAADPITTNILLSQSDRRIGGRSQAVNPNQSDRRMGGRSQAVNSNPQPERRVGCKSAREEEMSEYERERLARIQVRWTCLL